jgi:CheY-like chemotaxis protein
MSETLLIIDDEELICWSVKKEFEKKGMEVLTAFNAKDGMQSFTENHPDIVLLDVKLPDGSGLDLLKEPTRTPSLSSLPPSGEWKALSRPSRTAPMIISKNLFNWKMSASRSTVRWRQSA